MLSIRRKEKLVRVPKSRPVDQISPDSYLGNLALEKLMENRRDNPDDEPSSSKYSTSFESDSDSRTAHKKPREKLVLLSDQFCRRNMMDCQSRDLTTVSRFITEGTAYVVGDKVKHNWRVFVLSYHLKEKAYDFYTGL